MGDSRGLAVTAGGVGGVLRVPSARLHGVKFCNALAV